MAACAQAGVFSQRQALVLADGQIVLQGHIAVHGAGLVVKDDACTAVVESGISAQLSVTHVPPLASTIALLLTVRSGRSDAELLLKYTIPTVVAASRCQAAAIHRQRGVRTSAGLHHRHHRRSHRSLLLQHRRSGWSGWHCCCYSEPGFRSENHWHSDCRCP